MSQPGLLILDTHVWFWWVQQDRQLPCSIEQRIAEGQEKLAISAVAVYELTFATTIYHDALLVSVDSQFPHYEALVGRLIQR